MDNELLDSTTDKQWEKMKLPYQLIKCITNDFHKERILGSGAFGTVYKGVFENGKEIAVKVLHNNISGFDGEEFQKELQNLRELKHQNVVELVGFCDEAEKVLVKHEGKQVVALEMHSALCFEYVHNGSLRDHISDEYTGLDWHTRYKIIKGICEGLKYLREGLEFSVWHLDLKPGNILLNKKMMPKIADFGLSRLLSEEKTRKTINSFGTCGYWPPEYINHQVISEYFDIFSLGVILVKIMMGPEGYKRIADMTTRNFVKHVHTNWRKRLNEISRPRSLDVYCNQVRRCIEIALECLKPNRQERPTIQYIVSSLNETESVIGDRELQIEQFRDVGESTPHSMRSIASITSSGNDEASRPDYKYRFEFHLMRLKNDFSHDPLIRAGGYGEVYKVVLGPVIVVNILRSPPAFDDRLLQNAVQYLLARHQNIVKLECYCKKVHHRYIENNGELVSGGMRWSVLHRKYVVNGSLQRYIADGCFGLDWHSCYRLIKGIHEGLRYLSGELEHPSFIGMGLKSSKMLFLVDITLDVDMIAKIRSSKELRTLRYMAGLGSITSKAQKFLDKQAVSKKHDICSFDFVTTDVITSPRETRDFPFPGSHVTPKIYIKMVLPPFTNVHGEWRKTKSLPTTLRSMREEGSCHQMKKCIEIPFKCANHEGLKRPAIGDIIDMMNKTETVIQEILYPELLDVHPLELCFPLDSKKATSCSLHLRNKGDDQVAFMLVAKSPRSYLAKLPLCSTVPPSCTYTIVLTMRKRSKSELPTKSIEFVALQSVAVGDHDLHHVGQGSVTTFYDNLIMEAKEMKGHEVHEMTLKAVRGPPAKGARSESTQLMEIEIIATQNSQQVTSIDVHQTEPWIMTTHHGGSLRFWNYQSMAILNSFQVTEEPVHAAKFISREKWVVSGDGNGCILVYSYDEHQDVTSFDAHHTSITCLAVHPTRPFVLSSSHGDHLIKLWDWEKDWECIRTFQGDRVTQVTLNSDYTDDFASASSDGTIKIWSVDSDDGKVVTLDGLCVHYFMRRNRQHLITGTKDSNVAQIWNLDMEAGCVQKLEGHTGSITIVHLHSELPLLITGSLDGTVSLWNSTTYKIENIIDFNLGAVYAFGYIKGLRRMVVGCEHGIAMVEIPVLNIMGTEDTSCEYHEQSEYSASVWKVLMESN
uniref:Uncharacterized protein n=1 Tax=Avena sativa TaxID=4498 RepID=A0ACD5WH71_AVESA